MATFLHTSSYGLINADQIKQIESGPQKGSRWPATAILINGDFITLAEDIDEAGLALAPMVAATPGYIRLCYSDNGDDGPYISRTPVVAWRIVFGIAYPITPDDDDKPLTSWVLFPDGQVVRAGVQSHPDEATWVKAMEQEARENKATANVKTLKQQK